MKSRIFVTLAMLPVIACAEAAAQKKSQPITEGQFTDWKGIIDCIEIKKVFNINDYDTICITRIDAEAIMLPNKEDNTFAPTVNVLAQAAELSAEYMKKPFKKTSMTILATDDIENTPKEKALIVSMRSDEFDAGNRALRFWVGFGAGNAGVTLSGDITDAGTGETLVSFRHRRIAPMNASGHEKVLKTLPREVDVDIAKMLLQFR